MKKLTKEQFVERANKKHHNKYDYSKSIYLDYYEKMIIVCPIHGAFKQSPFNHLRGSDCLKCSISNQSFSKLKNFSQKFIAKANTIHNFKYDYSFVIYISSYLKVKIICPIHGEFFQTPKHHLSGHGCSKCAKNLKPSIKEFIDKANIIHNFKYDYSLVNYINAHVKIKIICLIHGIFKQSPSKHMGGRGCPHCSNSISKSSQKWLDGLNIKTREFKIPYTNYIADGYDPLTNTIYEFYGDKWHGNPLIYNRDDINPINKKSYGELYDETIKRENILKLMGYKLITIWESDFK